VVADLNGFFEAARAQDVPWQNARVFQPPIRRNIKLAECPSFGQTIFDYADTAPGAADYRALAQSVLAAAPGARKTAALRKKKPPAPPGGRRGRLQHLRQGRHQLNQISW
jgi:chromosome partitioning protein